MDITLNRYLLNHSEVCHKSGNGVESDIETICTTESVPGNTVYYSSR